MNEIPLVTSETDLAVYFLLSGLTLLEIQYEPRSNGRKRGIFIFKPDSRTQDLKNLFDSKQASINFANFKQTKSDLMDRLMKELP